MKDMTSQRDELRAEAEDQKAKRNKLILCSLGLAVAGVISVYFSYQAVQRLPGAWGECQKLAQDVSQAQMDFLTAESAAKRARTTFDLAKGKMQEMQMSPPARESPLWQLARGRLTFDLVQAEA